MHALAEGSYLNGKLLLVGTSERIDWNYVVDQRGGEQQTVDPWPETVEKFVSAVGAITKEIESVHRIAIGAILAVHVEDRDAGYRLVEHAVRNDFGLKIPADGSDFQAQLNRPTQSRIINGVTLNRLCQWSVQVTRPMQLRVRLTRDGSPEAHATGGDARYAMRFAIDFNTSAEWADEFKPEDRAPLIAELMRHAKEFVENRLA
jgi:hypothetical protein